MEMNGIFFILVLQLTNLDNHKEQINTNYAASKTIRSYGIMLINDWYTWNTLIWYKNGTNNVIQYSFQKIFYTD